MPFLLIVLQLFEWIYSSLIWDTDVIASFYLRNKWKRNKKKEADYKISRVILQQARWKRKEKKSSDVELEREKNHLHIRGKNLKKG